jgi:hypothetical protein
MYGGLPIRIYIMYCGRPIGIYILCTADCQYEYIYYVLRTVNRNIYIMYCGLPILIYIIVLRTSYKIGINFGRYKYVYCYLLSAERSTLLKLTAVFILRTANKNILYICTADCHYECCILYTCTVYMFCGHLTRLGLILADINVYYYSQSLPDSESIKYQSIHSYSISFIYMYISFFPF